MAKNGLPPALSCTSCASGAARSRLAVERIRNQLPEVSRPQRSKRDLLNPAAGSLIASSLRISG